MSDARLSRPTKRGLRARWRALRHRGDAGMATAEYAIGTLAAVGFAGLLLVILRSEQVRSLLLSAGVELWGD